MKKAAFAAISILACGIWGCDNHDSGRLVGFAVDGQTGQKLNFFKDSTAQKNLSDDSSNPAEIYAIVNGAFKRAVPCGIGDANSKNGIDASGCYKIEGLPVNTSLSVIAQYPGYQSVLSTVYIQRENTTSDRLQTYNSPSPQVIGNFRLFPLGFTIDYKVIAINANTLSPVANATVSCAPTSSGNLSPTGNGSFLNPELTLNGSVTAQTDATGVAVLAGTSLIMGASYTCDIYATALSSSYVLSSSTSFVAGISNATVRVQLNESNTSNFVEVISANNQNPFDIMGATANLVLHFNQPVEVVPNTVDCQHASFGGSPTQADPNAANAGKFTPDIINNGQSETASVSLSADGLIATLSTKGFIAPPDPQVLGTTIQFDGVFLRPIGGATNAGRTFLLGSATNGVGNNACALGASLGPASLRNIAINNTQSNLIRLF